MHPIITAQYLRNNRNEIFVFGDNLLRKGYGGAAALRDEPNTYGFITKKAPNNNNDSFYWPDEYIDTYRNEMFLLISVILRRPESKFLISKIGAGLANKHHIFEKVIEPDIKKIKVYKNVEFLW